MRPCVQNKFVVWHADSKKPVQSNIIVRAVPGPNLSTTMVIKEKLAMKSVRKKAL